jgi:hypothetical protein
MFIILISPLIALVTDSFIRRYKKDRQWTILIILFLIAPSILLVLTGYSFSLQSYSYIATTLFLTGIQLGLFTIIHVRFSIKVAASIAFILLLAGIAFLSLFASGWAPSRIIQEAKTKNYIALTLEPAYSDHKVLRIKKTALSGIIEKKVISRTCLIL